MLLVWLAAISVSWALLLSWPPRRFALVSLLVFFLVLPVAEFVPLVVIAELLLIARYAPEALSLDGWLFAATAGTWVGANIVMVRHYLAPVDVTAPCGGRLRHLLPLVWSAKGVTRRKG